MKNAQDAPPATRRKYHPFGRQSKYTDLYTMLNDDEVYSPAAIARFGEAAGYFQQVEEEKLFLARRRVRLSASRLAKERSFPVFGDQMVYLRGKPPSPGWYGWRWKNAVLNI